MSLGLTMYCPFCHEHTQISPVFVNLLAHGIVQTTNIPAALDDPRGGPPWWIGVCDNKVCRKPVLVYGSAQMIYPTPQPAPTDPRIPEHIRRDLDEAKRCATVSAWRACATVARRAIQAACLFKGADDGKKLNQQIEQLQGQGTITNDLREWAHEVRFLGNDGAHPPKDYSQDTVTEDDAADALELAEQFLEVVFVTPAIAAERKAKRTSS